MGLPRANAVRHTTSRHMCRRDVDTRVCLFFVACFLCLLLVFRRAPIHRALSRKTERRMA